ncbi:MAG: hypothetical protein AAFR42_03745 [Cyanobacteria bacterium J06628_6]
MDIKTILPVLAIVFTVACLFFGTQNGFYDSDDYHGRIGPLAPGTEPGLANPPAPGIWS